MYYNFFKLSKLSTATTLSIIFSLIGVGLITWGVVAFNNDNVKGTFLLLLGAGILLDAFSSIALSVKGIVFGSENIYKKECPENYPNKKLFKVLNGISPLLFVFGLIFIVAAIIYLVTI